MKLIERSAVRLVVLDARDRILLQESEFPDGYQDQATRLWITPGGGIDPGETHLQAARRELSEEIGLHEPAMEGPIWIRQHAFSFKGQAHRQSETFYVVRVDAHEVVPTDLLDPFVISHRWWTLDELQDSAELFAPTKLALYLEALLTDGLPSTPIDVGV